MFGGIKYEHRIYNEEFASKERYQQAIDKLLSELEERKNKVKKYRDTEIDCWENDKGREIFDEIVDRAMNTLEKQLNKLEDLRGDLR